ncbi:unnamed protein product [Cyprideis torosa]|uniref:protein disulfide-isomerase n=1 Tax=Cyprideis torosa TaxID=163714 RepID=A0A7R8W6U2_9CRUS|nr:unnamed protein product [Cyprideis torosa]CAG0884424.1 unnamed protein product [Cyprideis torosa]
MFLLQSFLLLLLVAEKFYCEDNAENDDVIIEPDINTEDIPVIEGYGGTINIPVDQDGVLILRKDNFHHVVQSRDLIMVEFFAPWCNHCRDLAPIYGAAAKRLKKYKVPLAKVDVMQEEDLSNQYGAQMIPQLMIFQKGKEPYVYEEARTLKAIVQHMRKLRDPNWNPPPNAVHEITPETFDDFIKQYTWVLLAFVSPTCQFSQLLEPEFESAASELKEDNVVLAKIDGTKARRLADKYTIQGWPSLKVFHEGEVINYDGPRDDTGIVKYMRDMIKFPSQELDSLKVRDSQRDACTVIQYVRQKLLDVAKDYLGSNSIIFAVSHEAEYQDELKLLGLDDSGEDVNIGLWVNDNVRFAMEPVEVLTSEAIRDFIRKAGSSKLKQVVKAPLTAKDQSQYSIKVVTASNFDELVRNSKNDVLVKFEGKGCVECEAAEPMFKQLAELTKTEFPNLDLARFDLFQNDFPPRFIRPTTPPFLVFLPAEDKDPVEYKGAGQLEDIKRFITKHSSIFLTDEERRGQNKDGENQEPIKDELQVEKEKDSENRFKENEAEKTPTKKDEL